MKHYHLYKVFCNNEYAFFTSSSEVKSSLKLLCLSHFKKRPDSRAYKTLSNNRDKIVVIQVLQGEKRDVENKYYETINDLRDDKNCLHVETINLGRKAIMDKIANLLSTLKETPEESV